MLPLLGIEFAVVEPQVEELTGAAGGSDPERLVVENALLKARAGAELEPDAIVLGVDTDVVLGSQLLGKPAHREGARRRLGALSGQIHQVLSGVALTDAGEERTAVARTAVTFRRLTAEEIAAYVATGEWEGRAGGYAVQGFGSSLIARIEGDLSNVIGLPLPLVAELLDDLQDGSQAVS